MIKHIVFISVPNKDESIKTEIKKRLLSMDGKINYLINIEVGLNFANEDRAYDVALVTEFETKEDLARYATDPIHVEVIKYLKSIPVKTKVVDYEI